MRIGGLVHARMTSERLPGKPLEKIGKQSAIQHLLDRLLASTSFSSRIASSSARRRTRATTFSPRRLLRPA